jgi:5-methylcytosine-specific restriction endonuclease McrA
MEFETTRCVVLNSTYEPIAVVASKRALILILEGKAVVVEEHPTLVVRSPSTTLRVPIMVALKQFVRGRKIFKTTAVLSQRNLFIRDNYTCQYCMRDKTQFRSSEFLTRDHIIPESRGGKDTWENLVTACSTCNNKKADYDLEEVNMKLQKKPSVPTLFELWMRHSQKRINTVTHSI